MPPAHVLEGVVLDEPELPRDGASQETPIEGAEHLATRSNAALFDLTPFAKLDVEGPDALAYLERICANRIDRPVGTIVYTAMLTDSGGIRCDLTIARKGEELFRVVTGGGSGVHLWDVATWRLRATHRLPVVYIQGVAPSPDGSRIAVAV